MPCLVVENLCIVAKETFSSLLVFTEPVAHPGNHIGITAGHHVAMIRILDSTKNLLLRADGLHSAGISCCLKHFPGHGDTFSDTHDGTVTVDKSWEELSRQELVPFVENMGKADMIMTAHITLENVSSDGLPASLSKEIITDRLRGELGYDGLIITDALAMSAVTEPYGSGTAAVMAFEAGNDILLMPESIKQAYGAVLEAVRNSEISMERLDESVLRILRYKLER